MALTFSHAVGYRGVCKLNNTLLLCTGGNINLTQEPIMSSGVWGAGYANIAPISFAWNYLQTEGSANFELTLGDVWARLREFGVASRTERTNILLLPDGKNGFNGRGWCSSLSFDASEGQAVTGTFNFKGDPDDNQGGIIAEGTQETSSTGVGASGGSLAGATLVPYWMTSVKDAGTGNLIDDVISWNCSYNSDLQLLKCCNIGSGLYQGKPLSADYILAGEMTADASITVFRIKGQFDPKQYHKVIGFQGCIGNVDSKDNGAYAGNYNTITIPRVVLNSASTSMTTGASYVSAEFSYQGLGDGVGSIFDMSTGSISSGDSSSAESSSTGE